MRYGVTFFVVIIIPANLPPPWIMRVARTLSKQRMIRLPDGIVTVHLDGERYRGAYYFRGERLVVTAYGLREGSADLSVLGEERGKAALNLAKLVLVDMVRETTGACGMPPGLALAGSTTAIVY